jgi:hypothetical protein
MKMVLEDMYSTIVAVPVLAIEVYIQYERGDVNLRTYLGSSDEAA